MGIKIFLVLVSALIGCDNAKEKSNIQIDTVETKSKQDQITHRIGYIAFNESLDDPTFKLCEPRYVWIYSPFDGVGYEGEKPALVKFFKDNFEPLENSNSNGYITIRFMVNCEGKAGRFRLIQYDEEYALTNKIDQRVIDRIFMITKALDGWQRNYYEGEYYDYHQYLTFKIENGDITEYLP